LEAPPFFFSRTPSGFWQETRKRCGANKAGLGRRDEKRQFTTENTENTEKEKSKSKY
jgi:hypothetical protein